MKGIHIVIGLVSDTELDEFKAVEGKSFQSTEIVSNLFQEPGAIQVVSLPSFCEGVNFGEFQTFDDYLISYINIV